MATASLATAGQAGARCSLYDRREAQSFVNTNCSAHMQATNNVALYTLY